MISYILHVSLNVNAFMMISSRSRERKCDMREFLSDENNSLEDIEYITNIKDIELNINKIWNLNDISLQEIDDNNDIHKRYKNLSSQYQE